MYLSIIFSKMDVSQKVFDANKNVHYSSWLESPFLIFFSKIQNSLILIKQKIDKF